MPMRSKPASRIWGAMSPMPMRRARMSSRCGSSFGSKASSPWRPHRDARASDDHRPTTCLGASSHRDPRDPDLLRSGARPPEQVQTSARPASHLCQVAWPRRRLKQWLRAGPQAIGRPAQEDQWLSRYVGSSRRSGYPHRGRHRAPQAGRQRLPDHSPDPQRLNPLKMDVGNDPPIHCRPSAR